MPTAIFTGQPPLKRPGLQTRPEQGARGLETHALSLPTITRGRPGWRLSLTSAARHFLVDGTKHRRPGGVEHLDAHAIAEVQKRRARRAGRDGLEHAYLGQAG